MIQGSVQCIDLIFPPESDSLPILIEKVRSRFPLPPPLLWQFAEESYHLCKQLVPILDHIEQQLLGPDLKDCTAKRPQVTRYGSPTEALPSKMTSGARYPSGIPISAGGEDDWNDSPKSIIQVCSIRYLGPKRKRSVDATRYFGADRWGILA